MGSRFATLYIALVITTLKVIGGYILFIIPGIRAQFRYAALPYVVMANEDLDYKQSVSLTKELYTKHLMESYGISTVGSLIPVIGQAVTASGFALSVEQLTNYKHANLPTPKTHWLNYLGLIFVFAIFLMLILAAVIFAVVLSRN